MSPSKKTVISLLIAAALFALPAHSLAKKSDQKHAGETPARHDLGESLKLKIQPSKKNMNELTFFGGNYLGDKWGNSWDIGGMYTFYFNDTFGVAANYAYSKIYGDSSDIFESNLANDNVHSVFGAVILNNDAAFRAGKSIIQCDLFATLGGGSIQINNIWKYLLVIGGGIRVYTPIPWFAVRFDVNSYMHPTPGIGGSAFNADILMNLGFSVMLPPRKIETKTLVEMPEVEIPSVEEATDINR
ncbi:MAG TPA: hypothetical protein PKU96_06340 [bacterium]|nr:MAG: hypothetical protein BWY40_00187 [bacterium ADurb.Bin270]HPW45970.1 hypothetical protein [bacterium]HQC50260.1 hypothetical protein [bacterium]